jgi:membrane associated rhomboid family serine protease
MAGNRRAERVRLDLATWGMRMFVPLYDHNPLNHLRFQWVTLSLILVNVAVFLLTRLDQPVAIDQDIAYAFGLTPSVLFDFKELPPRLAVLPEQLTLVSYMFFHAGWMHLLGNMAFLWVFGDNVEDAMGHFKFLLFYLLCGIAAGLLHALMAPTSDAPLVGASGAVAGVIAAYLILHPRVRVWVLVLWRIPVRISAMWALSFWVALQLFNLLTAADGDQVAWWAHIGGLAAGAALVVVLRRPGVRLFDRDLPVVVRAPADEWPKD